MQERVNENIQESSLEYKEHQEFFTEYYEIRRLFVRKLAESNTDLKLVRQIYELLSALIDWSNSQLRKVNPDKLKEIEERLEETFKQIQANKAIAARNELKQIFYEISDMHEESQLIPKIEIKKADEKESLDVRTRAALEAYNLIYCQE